MMYEILKKVYVLLFLIITTNLYPNKYTSLYRSITLNLSEQYGIPPEIIMGIAILESGMGNSKVAKKLNNHFGIVGKNNANYKTKYKQYISAEESFKDFCILISKKKFYKNLKGEKNYKIWIDKISKTGYSELPKVWTIKLLKTIQTNKLEEILIIAKK